MQNIDADDQFHHFKIGIYAHGLDRLRTRLALAVVFFEADPVLEKLHEPVIIGEFSASVIQISPSCLRFYFGTSSSSGLYQGFFALEENGLVFAHERHEHTYGEMGGVTDLLVERCFAEG